MARCGYTFSDVASKREDTRNWTLASASSLAGEWRLKRTEAERKDAARGEKGAGRVAAALVPASAHSGPEREQRSGIEATPVRRASHALGARRSNSSGASATVTVAIGGADFLMG